LWVVLAAKGERISVVQGSDGGSIDGPDDPRGGPVDHVGVEFGGGVRYVDVGSTVVGGGVALPEEVGLDLASFASYPLPIDLVEVVRLEDETADDARTGGGLGDHGDLSEEDVLGGTHGGSIGGRLDGEVGAIGTVVRHGGASGERPEVVGAFGEVGGNGPA
jgi:hypothetical protein